TYLKAVIAGAGSLAFAAPASGKIQLHVDLAVDPAKEQEMLHNFKTIFRPAAAKQPGYIDVQMLKLQSAVIGSAPAGLTYRLALTYASEQLRHKWVASATPQEAWPTIENTLSTKNYLLPRINVT